MEVQIAIPFRGNLDYLFQTLESVLRQDYSDWKVLVIDNASEHNNLLDLIKELNEPRISYIRHEKNIGMVRNFEFARESLTSEWGIIMGADDVFADNYLSTMVSYAEKFPKVGFIHPRVKIINEDGEIIKPIYDTLKNAIGPKRSGQIEAKRAVKLLLIGPWMYLPSIFWNIRFLKAVKWRIEIPIMADVDTEMSVVLSSGKFLQIHDSVFFYRRHGYQISTTSMGDLNRFREEAAYYEEKASDFWDKKEVFLWFLAVLRPSHRARAFLQIKSQRNLSDLKSTMDLAFFRKNFKNVSFREKIFSEIRSYELSRDKDFE